MIALVPFRTAAWIAFWTFSGEPSVPTWLTDQPSVFAPCCRIGPWTAQASTPQLMKVIFLPVGIGFLIGVVCVIAVGRALYLASSCWAADTDEFDELAVADPPLLLLLPLLPQPAASSAITASAAMGTSVTRRCLGVRRCGLMDMGCLLLSVDVGLELGPTDAPSGLFGQWGPGCDAGLIGAGHAGAVDA